MDLERVVYGEPQWAEPGIIRRQKRQAVMSGAQTAMIFVVIVLLVFDIATR